MIGQILRSGINARRMRSSLFVLLQIGSGRQDQNSLDGLAEIRLKVAQISGNEVRGSRSHCSKQNWAIFLWQQDAAGKFVRGCLKQLKALRQTHEPYFLSVFRQVDPGLFDGMREEHKTTSFSFQNRRSPASTRYAAEKRTLASRNKRSIDSWPGYRGRRWRIPSGSRPSFLTAFRAL